MFRSKFALKALLLMMAGVVALLCLGPVPVKALPLGARNLVLGSPLPLTATTHTFTFTLPNDPSNNSIQSFQFDYCETPRPNQASGVPADQGCVRPSGVDVSAATLNSESGTSGFTISSQDTNEIIVSTNIGQNLSNTTVQFVFGNAVNPGNISQPTQPFPVFFVRISAYQNPGGVTTSGNNFIDIGAVSSGSGSIAVNTQVPPILDFCAAVTVGQGCVSTSGNFLQFGNFSTLTTARATSQFAIGTNATNGASVTVNGTTMTSGNNTITAISSPAASLAGSPQFGINLRVNSAPPVGSNSSGGGTLVAAPDYDTPNLFKYKSGDLVASTPTSSDFQTFTVSYIVNIAHDQPVGVYDTTLTYICTANF